MANPLEHQLDYPFGEAQPAPGETLELVPGVRWVRMSLPFALDHINLWLLRDRMDGREGWTIVDCGIATEQTRTAWEQVFATQLDGLPVLRVVVTHMHPDHVGLAHWLTERWSTPEHECRLWMSATDWNAARSTSAGYKDTGQDVAGRFFMEHGLRDPASLDKVRARASYYTGLVPQVPARFRRLMDGLVLTIGGRDWRCIAGYGHSPEHMALYCEQAGVLISGDMLLPRISTNVSVFEFEPEANPLPLYLASIGRFEPLPDNTLVLPSHGRPFRGIKQRIAQLRQHHDERLADVIAACNEQPLSAAEMMPVLFKRALDLHQTTFAMGESIAHLNALWQEGRLVRRRGDDGVLRFGTA